VVVALIALGVSTSSLGVSVWSYATDRRGQRTEARRQRERRMSKRAMLRELQNRSWHDAMTGLWV
jgi:hypothetical protein